MIKIDNVSFKYNSATEMALDNINLTIQPGTVTVLLGGSGCGKTTVTRLINHLVPEFYTGDLTGKITIDDTDISECCIQDLTGTVGSVFQDPRSQFFATDTTAEIAFSCENMSVPREEMHQRVEKVTDDLKIRHLRDRSIFELSSGEKQSIAIASVYALEPKILVLDEPSANLDGKATENLRKVLVLLKNKGYTIIISEHRIHYLKDLVDRAVIFEKGHIKQELSAQQFRQLSNEKAKALGLRSIDLTKLKPQADAHKGQCQTTGQPLASAYKEMGLEFSNVNFFYKKERSVLQNVSFAAPKGAILGVVGHNGVGKTTILELICGLQKEKAGTIKFNGQAMKPKQRIKNSYIVLQDSDYQLFSESVEKELFLEHPKDQELRAKGSKLLEYMGLSHFAQNHPASLSGGQKQRLCIAIAALKDSPVICFDEPTSGLDYNNMKTVSALLRNLAAMGKTLLVTTHDYEFLMEAATHILYLDQGTVKDFFPVTEDTAGKIYDILG